MRRLGPALRHPRPRQADPGQPGPEGRHRDRAQGLSWPARQIVENSGEDGSFIVGKLLDSKDVNYGYDAQKGEFTDMIKAGITDPTKVVRHALQDAASIAGLLITTEAMVAEKPEPKSPMPAMPPGGGMGRMDF